MSESEASAGSEDNDLLSTLMTAMPSMSKSEAKVAAIVLDDPERVTGLSIAALAKEAGVSEPTVNRFSKKFGASGFPDFKLRLARAVVPGVRYVSQAVNASDSIDTVARKLFDNTIKDLLATRETLPSEALGTAVSLLASARSVTFVGLGTSAAVARDAEHKFLRFGVPVSAHTDPVTLRMLAAGAQAGDVFFLISHTGRTKVLLELAELIQHNGATLISMTSPDSALAVRSDCALGLKVEENTEQYLPMSSRIVQLVILDALAAGITLAKGPAFLDHLAKLKNSLKDTRLSNSHERQARRPRKTRG